MRFIVFICSLLFHFSVELEINNVQFVIISQNNNYNNQLREELENNLKEQTRQLQWEEPKIFVSGKHFKTPSHWTITPLIPLISNSVDKNTKWVIFLEDRTTVSLKILLEKLEKYNPDEEIWIGHTLFDSEATIIHHFAFHQDPTFFKYPNLGSGFAISLSLLKRLKSRIDKGLYRKIDFHIDPAHEFALFVYEDGKGPMMQHGDTFCCEKGPTCGTYPKKFEPCGDKEISSIYFSIKTCQKFHKDRINVVQNTWLKHTIKHDFFSDFEDPNIPTTSLGIPNTEQGHCQKTMAIFKYTLKEFETDSNLKWLALVDDDTILSVSRMTSLVTCHQTTAEPLILGERYRFGENGFNYPTGGAGILINRAALQILAHTCQCPRPDAPDDMVLGACAQEFGINIIHVPQMHQARPSDYAPGRLATNDSITFHKHWMIDPVRIYEQWFSMDDKTIVGNKYPVKVEL